MCPSKSDLNQTQSCLRFLAAPLLNLPSAANSMQHCLRLQSLSGDLASSATASGRSATFNRFSSR